MCTSHPPVAVRSSRGRAASDKAPETLSIPPLWSCADNPRESGESCECILKFYAMLFGESRCDECDPYSSDAELPTKYRMVSDRSKKW